MPRNRRGDLKLKHDQIMNHIETAMAYTSELHNLFLEPHPDHAEGYANICVVLAQAHEFVSMMKRFI